MTLRIAFAGTPTFAAQILSAIIDSTHRVAGVFTQPDRPSGRGRKLTSSAVKQLAATHSIPVHSPDRLDTASVEILRDYQCDVAVVAAYGLLLPAAFLATPKYGCLNVHASLLPRWRGAAPIQRAILAGDTVTGICIMQMDAGLDTGDVLASAETDILPNDTAGTLHDRLLDIGRTLTVSTLDSLPDLHPQPQDDRLATYAHKLTKAEAMIDWREDAQVIERKIRAYNPWPIAHTRCAGHGLKVFEARADSSDTADRQPGAVLELNSEAIVVAAGRGRIHLTSIQRAGARRLRASEFLKARHLAVGDVLGQ